MRPRLLATVSLSLLSALAFDLAPAEAEASPTYPVDAGGIAFVDVGQGSAALLFTRGGRTIAVDAGPADASEAILATLEAHGRQSIDLWIFTHYDADHIGGMPRVLAGRDGVWDTEDDLRVGEVWDRGDEARDDGELQFLYSALWLEAERRWSTVRRRAEAGWSRRVDEVEVEIVRGPEPARRRENDRGLALCVIVEGHRIFMPGDLPAELGEAAARACAPADLWWVNHHGASDGSRPELVETLQPTLSVVSAGRDNSHCHPSLTTLADLAGRDLWILDGAGRSARGPCPALNAWLDPLHRWAFGGLWLAWEQLEQKRGGKCGGSNAAC